MDSREKRNLLIGINILKRVIERLSTSLSMDEKSQQDALEIANQCIESLFTKLS